jgi:hypothetical protein
MAEIIENTRIGSEQASQFLPKQRFNIPKSTTQKVKSTITSLNSGLVSSNNFAASAGTPYTFVLNPNNQTVFDLSQCYFNISGSLRVPPNYKGAIDTRWIKLGNLFVSSLFQQATLSIGGSVVALNANPGVDANMQAALKFDAFDLQNMSLSNREFLLNNLELDFATAEEKTKFNAGDFKIYNVYDTSVSPAVMSTTSAMGESVTLYPQYAGMIFNYTAEDGIRLSEHCTATNLTITFDDTGKGTLIVNNGAAVEITTAGGENSKAINDETDNPNKTFKILGFEDKFNNQFQEVIPPYIAPVGSLIPFRCKLYLSDLFNYTVDSLDYIFNREIAITLQRTSTNFIIANIAGSSSTIDTKIDVVGIDKFELIAFSYVLTDDARKELLQFYSKPVQTLYGVQTTNLTPLYNFNGDSEQNITLPLTVTYDTKAILLAFPKCSNSWTTLSTGFNQKLFKQITGDGRLANNGYQLSWFGSAANSYNFAGLKYIRISNTSNSNIYTYDFNATSEKYMGPVSLLKSFDVSNSDKTAQVNILDYREAYSQMKQLRLLFGKDPDNALSYYDYLKDYVIIPIDLTGSNLPPNTRIFVTFQFASFGKDYNPLHYGNDKENKQLTTNLLAIFLGSDVLEYRPDGTCVVKHVLQAAPKETEVQLK